MVAEKKTKADLILHPIRMRILMALSGEERTSQQLADELKDIPQATLYRHINKLAKAMVIRVVEERQVRGSIEKVYTIDERAAHLGEEEIRDLSKDDHMRYFIAFIASMLDDFSRYLQNNDSIDLLEDGVSYQKFPLAVSDEELEALGAQINDAFKAFQNNPPDEGRRRRIFSFTVLPDEGANNKTT